jgi:hypothetical protein
MVLEVCFQMDAHACRSGSYSDGCTIHGLYGGDASRRKGTILVDHGAIVAGTDVASYKQGKNVKGALFATVKCVKVLL